MRISTALNFGRNKSCPSNSVNQTENLINSVSYEYSSVLFASSLFVKNKGIYHRSNNIIRLVKSSAY